MEWLGRDINDLSREELLDVVRHLGRQLAEARANGITLIKLNQLFIERLERQRATGEVDCES